MVNRFRGMLMPDADFEVGLLQIGCRELCNPILERTAAARAWDDLASFPQSRRLDRRPDHRQTPVGMGIGSRRHAGMDEVFSSQQDSCKLGKVAGRDETGWGGWGTVPPKPPQQVQGKRQGKGPKGGWVVGLSGTR